MKKLFRFLTLMAATTLCLNLLLSAGAVRALDTAVDPPSFDHSADTLTRSDTGPKAADFKAKGLLKGVTQTECIDKGKCSICEMVQVGVNIGNYILAIAGAAAFFFVAWGAFGFVTARGDEEHIKEAKTTIWNALAGVVLVLIGWQIVAVILVVLTGNGNPFANVCGSGVGGLSGQTGSSTRGDQRNE